jgi:uncharacterized protein YhdP
MRKILIGAGVLLGVLILLVAGSTMFFDVNRYKPQIEQAVANATGLNLKINGKASLRLFPHIHVALRDVHLSNPSQPGEEIFSMNEIQVAPQALPFLLHRQMIVNQISLVEPKLRIQKSAAGRMNFETPKLETAQRAAPSKHAAGQKAPPTSAIQEIHSIILENGAVSYVDRTSGTTVTIGKLNVNLSGVAWNQIDPVKSLSFHGRIDAGSVKSGTLAATEIKAQIRDEHGLIDLDPIQAAIFGGSIRGTAEADLRRASPKIKIAQTLSGIDLDQAVPGLKNRVTGTANGTVNLSTSGKGAQSLTKDLNGTVAIRGQNIKTSVDVDKIASNLKSPQVMDLAKLGSSLFSSSTPEKAGQAAGTAGSTVGQFAIHDLVSNWKIHQGVAETQKVALATSKNTVAFKGSVNLNSRNYQDFYIATVDDKGCAQKKVQISGPLTHPHPELGKAGEQMAKSYLEGPGSPLGSKGSPFPGVLGALEGGGPKTGGGGAKPSAEKSCDQFYRA